MKDRLWQAVYDAVRPLLNDDDVIMAPRGEWPPFPGIAIFYDELIDLGGCTVLVLHKGQLTALPKTELRSVAEEWQWIFANEVFLVFSRSPRVRKDIRQSAAAVHCRPLARFLSSASLRNRQSKIVYVHVPKTGGTSIWASLTKAFPSHVYYPSVRAYLSNPPGSDDYDLIGLHFSPSVVLPSLRPDDWVIGMVRDPTQRLLSALMHSRRPTEDVTTFTASAKAMRDMGLTQYMATDFGRHEARLQLVMFGTDYRRSARAPTDEEMLHSARAFTRRESVILAPSELSPSFMEFVAYRLGFRPGTLQRLNAKEPRTSANLAEIGSAIGLINSINASEREFYDFVCQSFAKLRAAHRGRRSRSNWLIALHQRSPVRGLRVAAQAARAGQSGSLWPSGTEGRAQ
jgi:hypothetical protein